MAIDDSPQSASAFNAARKLAPNADFKLVHAVDIPLPFQQALLRAGASQGEIAQYRAARTAAARKELSAFPHDYLDTSELSIELLDGEPGTALVRFSRSAPVDLLALGTHGRGKPSSAVSRDAYSVKPLVTSSSQTSAHSGEKEQRDASFRFSFRKSTRKARIRRR